MEIDQWLKRVNTTKGDDVQKLVDELIADEGQRLYYSFSKAMTLAGQLKGQSGSVPPRLEQVIQILGNKDSGFTGLTNWEAYISNIKKESRS